MTAIDVLIRFCMGSFVLIWSKRKCIQWARDCHHRWTLRVVDWTALAPVSDFFWFPCIMQRRPV